MSEWAYKWISFDMSRAGLQELDGVLTNDVGPRSPELQNFHNEIQNMLERAPEEAAWLDA